MPLIRRGKKVGGVEFEGWRERIGKLLVAPLLCRVVDVGGVVPVSRSSEDVTLESDSIMTGLLADVLPGWFFELWVASISCATCDLGLSVDSKKADWCCLGRREFCVIWGTKGCSSSVAELVDERRRRRLLFLVFVLDGKPIGTIEDGFILPASPTIDDVGLAGFPPVMTARFREGALEGSGDDG